MLENSRCGTYQDTSSPYLFFLNISFSRDRSPLKHVGDMANDLHTVEARVFVGSLVKPISKKRLEEHFSRWGRVKGDNSFHV